MANFLNLTLPETTSTTSGLDSSPSMERYQCHGTFFLVQKSKLFAIIIVILGQIL
jgi:hypothetical protein